MAKRDSGDKRKKSGSGFFWGLVFGIVVGAALAILFAPQSGEETRDQLNDQLPELTKRGQLRYDEIRSQFRERFGDAFALGREAGDQAKNEVLSRYSRAKNAQ
jgi:gas vesicle protein